MNIAKMYRAWLDAHACDAATVTRIAQFAVTAGDAQLLKRLLDEHPEALTGPMIDQLIARNHPPAVAVLCTAATELPAQILSWIGTGDAADLRAVFSTPLGNGRWHPKATTALFRRREPVLKFVALLNSDRGGRVSHVALQRRARWFVDGWPWHGRLGCDDADALELLAAHPDATDLVLGTVTDPVLAIELMSTNAATQRTFFARDVEDIVTTWLDERDGSTDVGTVATIARWLLTATNGRCRYVARNLEPVARRLLDVTANLPGSPGTALSNLRRSVADLDEARRAALEVLDAVTSSPGTLVTPDVIADPCAAARVAALARDPLLPVDQAVTILATDGAPPGSAAAMLREPRTDRWLGELADALLTLNPQDVAYRAVVTSMTDNGRADWVVAHSQRAGNIRRALRDGLVDATVLGRLPVSLLDDQTWSDATVVRASWELVVGALGANADAWAVLEHVDAATAATLNGFLDVAAAVASAH